MDYVLSLFNCKIILCLKLLLNSSNYLKNIGFYVGSIITLICIVLMFINITFGIRYLNKIIKENVPSKKKLEKKKREQCRKLKKVNNLIKHKSIF